MNKENVVAMRVHIHTREFYSAMRKEILPFVTTWMKLEDIMLCEIRQSETNTV